MNELIFVYGTLKEGYGNHRILDYRFGGKSRKISLAYTFNKYGLTDCGFPYMLDKTSLPKRRVLGELYEVYSPDVLERLDALEGVDFGHYSRKRISVVDYFDGEVYSPVWAYLTDSLNGERYEPCPLIKEGDEEFYKWERY